MRRSCEWLSANRRARVRVAPPRPSRPNKSAAYGARATRETDRAWRNTDGAGPPTAPAGAGRGAGEGHKEILEIYGWVGVAEKAGGICRQTGGAGPRSPGTRH